LWAPNRHGDVPLAVADIQAMENAMYVHFTNTQLIIGFGLFLIIIFALAAFLDKRWRTTALLREFGSDHKPNFLRQKSNCDDEDRSSELYTRHADLSARGLGTAEPRITFRGEKQQNLARD